jgi:hypothetical protein
MRIKRLVLFILMFVFASAGLYLAHAWTPVVVEDDPLVRMPGTQPGQVSLEAPGRCLNCHAGYDKAVEPGFNWKGSMMAQASRDFLFWSCLTVAAQDSIWAIGTPNAVDICERCHFPKGWLEGRSDPTNASIMTAADFDGVQCDFCHTSWDPFFETTSNGTREGSDWQNYWDETNVSGTPSQPAADDTYAEDAIIALGIDIFNGDPFFNNNNLPPSGYTENGSGQYFISPNGDKRASFADAAARHRMLYSRYHKSKYFCGTCHDVSNPALANLGQDGSSPLTSETDSAFSYYHVERTFSEFMLSAYGKQGGFPTNPEFQAQGAPDITHASKCQDCHMRDVVGVGCNKKGVPVRPNESVEHPNSGQPLHDMTGGNAWVSWVLASAIPGSSNYDAFNDQQLNQGPAALTLDLSQGQGIDPEALLAGVDRAKQQLLLAATIKNLSYDAITGALSFRIHNNTPHKLISGFPEGRRMFVNIKAYSSGSLVYEVNPYDFTVGTLKGLPNSPNSPSLGTNEVYNDELVYEMHPNSVLTGEDETFHFALATGRYKDNRIPPRGFDIGKAEERLSEPVWHGESAPEYFATYEYADGYDEVSLTIPTGADTVEVKLYYQTTSREYVEFLRDEIKGTASTLSNPTLSGEPEAYIIQTDPFFNQLRAWGDTIWQLWMHNKDVDGAAPFLMTQATIGTPPEECTAPVPSMISAAPGHSQVELTWSDELAADEMVAGYKLYYDQAGKAQLIIDIENPTVTSYIDSNLTDGVEYCYKVSSYYDDTCESGFSEILCAIPENQGQTTPPAGVTSMEVGYWSGKGKNQTWNTSPIPAGETVVIRVRVVDTTTDTSISNATVEIVIGGPETVTLNSGPSGADGWAEATWNTKAPGRKNPGTTPGGYTATTTNVTATGYHWDGVTTSTSFTIQQ